MSPFSAPVLGGAALMSAPAWWNAVEGTVPASEAVTRFLVSVAICWFALEVLTAIVGPAPSPPREDEGSDGSADADDARAEEPSLWS